MKGKQFWDKFQSRLKVERTQKLTRKRKNGHSLQDHSAAIDAALSQAGDSRGDHTLQAAEERELQIDSLLHVLEEYLTSSISQRDGEYDSKELTNEIDTLSIAVQKLKQEMLGIDYEQEPLPSMNAPLDRNDAPCLPRTQLAVRALDHLSNEVPQMTRSSEGEENEESSCPEATIGAISSPYSGGEIGISLSEEYLSCDAAITSSDQDDGEYEDCNARYSNNIDLVVDKNEEILDTTVVSQDEQSSHLDMCRNSKGNTGATGTLQSLQVPEGYNAHTAEPPEMDDSEESVDKSEVDVLSREGGRASDRYELGVADTKNVTMQSILSEEGPDPSPINDSTKTGKPKQQLGGMNPPTNEPPEERGDFKISSKVGSSDSSFFEKESTSFDYDAPCQTAQKREGKIASLSSETNGRSPGGRREIIDKAKLEEEQTDCLDDKPNGNADPAVETATNSIHHPHEASPLAQHEHLEVIDNTEVRRRNVQKTATAVPFVSKSQRTRVGKKWRRKTGGTPTRSEVVSQKQKVVTERRRKRLITYKDELARLEETMKNERPKFSMSGDVNLVSKTILYLKDKILQQAKDEEPNPEPLPPQLMQASLIAANIPSKLG
eukprot:scaffold5649_cov130-Cylindrotheca_fusiformis.AAC.3